MVLLEGHGGQLVLDVAEVGASEDGGHVPLPADERQVAQLGDGQAQDGEDLHHLLQLAAARETLVAVHADTLGSRS